LEQIQGLWEQIQERKYRKNWKKGIGMSKLSLEVIEDSEAKAEIWREEEHDSTSHKSVIKIAKTALKSSINSKIPGK
jgi:hypothetical protein